MNDNIKVSICVPVYNVEQYIERCIVSIMQQTLHEIEIIVVDDCTPDKSMDIVKNLSKVDSRIKIIKHNENHGLMWARRTAYMEAIGEYITFCDSDDTLPYNALETLYKEAVLHNADIVSGDMSFIHTNGKTQRMDFYLNYGTDNISVYRSLLRKEYGHNLCSKLFRRDLLQKHKYKTYDHAINGEDGILFYQVVRNIHNAVHINKVVYHYWQNMESSSNTKMSKWGLECVIIGNSLRVETCGVYKELYGDLRFIILSVMSELYRNGYNNDGYLRYLIDRYELSRFISIQNILLCKNIRVLLKALYFIIIKNKFGR